MFAVHENFLEARAAGLGHGHLHRQLAARIAGALGDKIFLDAVFNVLTERLNVMDASAFSLCMDNRIPIIVFDLTVEGNIKKVISGEAIGTIVQGE